MLTPPSLFSAALARQVGKVEVDSHESNDGGEIEIPAIIGKALQVAQDPLVESPEDGHRVSALGDEEKSPAGPQGDMQVLVKSESWL